MPEFIALSITILLFSVILHEVMHGLVALKFGDRTAERAGRLTLNPIPHIDPIGTILLPGLLILSGSPMLLGWAKPVPVNPLNFSDLRRGELLVSAAGILANFGLAIIGTILFHILSPILGLNNVITHVLSFAVTINLILGIFNLFPIPPLDGSKILMSQLPYNLARAYERLAPYGMFILFALLWFTPIFSIVIGGVLGFYSNTFGIPLRLF